jgi:hypothetical protein
VQERRPVTMESLFAGFAFIRSQPVVLGAISLDLFAMLLGSVTALLPIFAKDILQTGPWGLGLLRSAPAIGAPVSAVVTVPVTSYSAPVGRRATSLNSNQSYSRV